VAPRPDVSASILISPEEAVRVVRSGDTVMVGGFGLVGAPLALIDALVEHSDATDLTIVSNNIGEPGRGLGKLLRQKRIRRGISSYFTSNPEAVAAVNAGELDATLVPQGTFELGNLWYRRTARNFNPLMATAAACTIAEAGEIVPVGELEPESIVTPQLYVDHLVESR
jgi:acyl CoA:acetate/3-ketoacid CoA transferase alpha subunit